MDNGEIEIKKLTDPKRIAARRVNVFKKAKELAILCDAQVAVMIRYPSGELFDFSSIELNQILSRYKSHKSLESFESPTESCTVKMDKANHAGALKAEIDKLRKKQLQLAGEELEFLDLSELRQLEDSLSQAYLSVGKRKEQVIMEQIEQLKLRKQLALIQTETLRKKVNELRGVDPPTQFPVLDCAYRKERFHHAKCFNKQFEFHTRE